MWLFNRKKESLTADPRRLAQTCLPNAEKIRPVIFSPEARTYHYVGESIGKVFEIENSHNTGGNKKWKAYCF